MYIGSLTIKEIAVVIMIKLAGPCMIVQRRVLYVCMGLSIHVLVLVIKSLRYTQKRLRFLYVFWPGGV